MRRDPEDELNNAFIALTFRQILKFAGYISLCLILSAIYISTHPNHIEDDQQPNKTDFIRNNFKFYENGNGSIYIENPDGEREWIPDDRIPYYIEQMSMFTFGFGNHSFCYQRNVTDVFVKPWATSLFRASQLYSSVQTSIRAGVLIFLVPMFFYTYISTKPCFNQESSFFSGILATLYLANELLIVVTYFLVTALHVYKDRKTIPYSTVYFSMALYATIFKFTLKSLMEGFKLSSFLRLFAVIIFSCAHDILADDISDYAQHIYCDTYTTPIVTILQLCCISMIFFNYWHEVHNARYFQLICAPDAREKSTQKVTKKSIFVRVN